MNSTIPQVFDHVLKQALDELCGRSRPTAAAGERQICGTWLKWFAQLLQVLKPSRVRGVQSVPDIRLMTTPLFERINKLTG
jgi:hypothetical protein